MIRNVLSIAGSDPSGGAGIQADLKAFAANGVYGMAAITALTAQNTRGVTGVELVPPTFVAAQIEAVFEDIRVDAIKIGMIASAEIARVVCDALERRRARAIVRAIVLDPVMVATGGDRLLAPEGVAVLRDRLLPVADVLTPNLPEAAVLLGEPAITERSAMPETAEKLRRLGPQSVLLKGGHLASDTSPDYLATSAGGQWLEAPRTATANTHGTGCTLSAALAAQLAVTGDVFEAARRAKTYVRGAIACADQLDVGSGNGPIHHFHALWRREHPA